MTITIRPVALVTGCARWNGLGRAIALRLARDGANVAVSDLSLEGTRNAHEQVEGGDRTAATWRGLTSVTEEIEALGVSGLPVVGDVGLSSDVERMVGEVIDRFGRIDILVNNAAAPQGADRGVTWEVPEEAFDLVMRVNTKGVFLMSTAVARHMITRGGPGRIINIASSGGRRGFPRTATYCASKFAMIALTQSMAAELAEYGVTVNALCPSPTDTSRSGPNREKVAATIPLGRLGTPTDVANAVAFFASEQADFITGQALNVDGGLIMS
jgi:3-oxoacyl-[acyl-carrier protein] reductase